MDGCSMTKRRKAVKDRANHREKVHKWHAKTAKKVAFRLLGAVIPKDRTSFESVNTAMQEAKRLGLNPNSR